MVVDFVKAIGVLSTLNFFSIILPRGLEVCQTCWSEWLHVGKVVGDGWCFSWAYAYIFPAKGSGKSLEEL